MIDQDDAGEKKDFLPPLEFGSIVFPFYTQALVKLGLMDDPLQGSASENLELAKRLIDLLDMLRDRTKGNLDDGEQKFLEACLSHLKLNYLKRVNIVKT
jgi:hypothetical protein